MYRGSVFGNDQLWLRVARPMLTSGCNTVQSCQAFMLKVFVLKL